MSSSREVKVFYPTYEGEGLAKRKGSPATGGPKEAQSKTTENILGHRRSRERLLNSKRPIANRPQATSLAVSQATLYRRALA